MIDVLLCPEEVQVAAYAGINRHVAGYVRQTNGVPVRQARIPISWDDEVEGACAELAVAKFTGLYWTGLQFARGAAGADVGTDIDVRWTKREPPELLVKEWDEPSFRYVLVTGRAPLMHVHGYMKGEDAKVDKYWDVTMPRPCFVVPLADLIPLYPRNAVAA